MKTQKCSICKEEFPATLEYFGKHKTRGLDTYCSPCRHEVTKKYYHSHKEKMKSQSIEWKRIQRQKINEIKDTLHCLRCNESRNHLLDFHHIDPTQKDFQISQGEAHGWDKVKNEIDKCVVLCSNCHRDFHYQEKQNNITLEEYLK